MRVNYINNETRDFLGAQQNHVCGKKLERLRKQRITPLKRGLCNERAYFENRIYQCDPDLPDSLKFPFIKFKLLVLW